LDFDGVDDVFVNPEDTDRFQLPLNTDFIFGFVVVPGASTGNEQVIFSQGGIGTDGSLQIILDDSNGNNRIKFNTQYNGTPETVLSGDGAYTIGNPVILIVSRIDGIVKFRSNGVEPGFPPQYSDIPYNTINTTDAAYIGAAFDADTETLVDFFSGDFYELILLKETQDQAIDQLSYREELEGYFAEKYKVKSLLPSGHPFSLNPPRASVIKEEVISDETPPQYNCSITRTTVSNTQFDDTSHSGETIAVETQSDCQWSATTNNSWITLTNTAHIGNGTVNFSVAQHSGSEDRTGTITIITVEGITETISITQTAGAGVIWAQISGGTETFASDYKYSTFTSDSTLTVSTGGVVEYCIVAGGGGGGRGNGGSGGGAGGMLTGTASLSSQSYTITVGAGGADRTGSNGVGNNGDNSTFAGSGFTTLTAIGGGGGAGTNQSNGAAGGSGGGASWNDPAGVGGSGTAGQGNDGGAAQTPNALGGGCGGGGAGAVGGPMVYSGTGSAYGGGDGGDGLEWPAGSGTYYAGGGGGMRNYGAGANGIGGTGGGGDAFLPGTANTGGGGGGKTNDTYNCAGGSGIVIVRSKVAWAQASGGTETISGGYKYHTFTSDGTLTVSGSGNVEYLIVGGGGGGGQSNRSGGGGAGEAKTGTTTLSAQNYTITIGAGGAEGIDGSSSSAFGLTSVGGGKGGYYTTDGGSGGSGGGGGPTSFGGTATAGNDGGDGGDAGGTNSNRGSGGGGGAGAAGGDGGVGANGAGGDGGAGIEWPTGSGTYYAGGGGGFGIYSGNSGGDGGAGGGGGGGGFFDAAAGSGGSNGGQDGQDDTTGDGSGGDGGANTGGGGGGRIGNNGSSGTGGSGIVIVRYKI